MKTFLQHVHELAVRDGSYRCGSAAGKQKMKLDRRRDVGVTRSWKSCHGLPVRSSRVL